MSRADLVSYYNSAIVRIWSAKEEVVGVGFFVSPNKIVTCGHVIEEALGYRIDNNSYLDDENVVFIDSPLKDNPRLLQAKLIYYNYDGDEGQNDIAGLEVESEATAHIVPPLVLLQPHVFWQHSFRAYGFPELKQGVWTKGEILGGIAEGWIQIQGEENAGHFVEQGFSGSPVWDDELSAIVGMIIAVEKPISKRTAFFVSMQEMVAEWPDLLNISLENLSRIWNRELSGQYQSRGLNIKSPLEESLENYLRHPFWHEEILKEIQHLQQLIYDFAELGGFARQLARIDVSQKYSEIRESCKRLVADYEQHYKNVVNQIITHKEKELKVKGRDLFNQKNPTLEEKRLLRLYGFKSGMSRLQTQFVLYPQYNHCFLTIGEMGTGKSFFVDELVTNKASNTWCVVVPPDYPQSISLAKAVCLAAQDFSGICWPDLGTIDYLLEQRNKQIEEKHSLPRYAAYPEEEDIEEDNIYDEVEYYRDSYTSSDISDVFAPFPEKLQLIIIFDDLSRFCGNHPFFMDELEHFIEENTRLHNVRWIITAPQFFYYALVPQSPSLVKNSFWYQYGIGGLKNINAIGRWIVLEDLDVAQKVGIQIILEYLERVGQEGQISPEFEEMVQEEERITELLCNPFIAWIWLDYIQEVHKELPNDWQFINFIQAFWETQSRRLLEHNDPIEGIDRLEIALSNLVNWIGRYLNETGDFYPKGRKLLYQIQQYALKDYFHIEYSRLQKLLNVLSQGLVIKERRPTSSSGVTTTDVTYELLIDGFWGFVLARQIQEKYHGVSARNMAEFESRFAKIHPQMLRATLEFYLWLEENAHKTYDIVLAYVRFVLQGSRLPRASVWRFGSRANIKVQQVLWKLVNNEVQLDLDRETTHALLIFLGKISPDLVTLGERFQKIQLFYKHIAKNTLSEYFSYVARKYIEKIEHPEEVLEIMPHFSWCEPLGVAEELARLVVETLLDRVYCGKEIDKNNVTRSLEFILKYAKRINLDNIDARDIPDHDKGWKRYLFREWVFYWYFDQVTPKAGIPLYEILVTNGWYKRQHNELLQKHMEQEANMAFGKYYRHNSRNEDFHRFVHRLVNSEEIFDRENAGFIIAHTVPSEKGVLLEDVALVFHESIRKLKEDTMAFRHKRPKLIDRLFAQLEKE